MEVTISKSTAEIYKLRGTDGSFANITLDYSDREEGRVSISTDFGVWSNYWGSCGSPFKEFLIGLDMHYAANKFGECRWFDLQATLLGLKSRIRDNAENKQHKRILIDELRSLGDCDNKDQFVAQMWNCSELMKFEDGCPDMVTSVSPGFNRFWHLLWKPFVEALKEELETMQPA